MDIGIIRPYEVEFNPEDVVDLENAARDLGLGVKRIYIDMMDIRLGRSGVYLSQLIGRSIRDDINVSGAVLRHIGVIKDFEQFSFRIWAVRALELSGVYVMNPVINWLIASDKFASLLVLAKNGLPVPDTVVSENMFVAYNAVKEFENAVVKQLRGAMGFGVFQVSDADVAFHIFSYLVNLNKPMYVQRYLEKVGGGDYRVVVVGDEVIGAEFRRAASSWKSNVAQGARPEPVKLAPELEELSLRAIRVLGLDFGGVDIAETRDGYFILEVNPTMSWQGFKRVTGKNPAHYIIKYLVSKIKR
ncbi:ATP-grasp domain-containing protein [Vulcanisaeta thermophila]|uniref:ATP-grasp domain-containing protein n=1 Tax=Vulcanisaeta thermophila TaxID=867917 RepID=UPI0008533D62|nr:RimK family alpha-L-glutamate ligase [Vulcanisaeta thermophila]